MDLLVSNMIIIIIDLQERDLFLGRPRRRWKDNIRMDFKKIGISTKNWVDSVQDMDHWRAIVNSAFETPDFMSHRVS